jgi:hypothetical protein
MALPACIDDRAWRMPHSAPFMTGIAIYFANTLPFIANAQIFADSLTASLVLESFESRRERVTNRAYRQRQGLSIPRESRFLKTPGLLIQDEEMFFV